MTTSPGEEVMIPTSSWVWQHGYWVIPSVAMPKGSLVTRKFSQVLGFIVHGPVFNFPLHSAAF